MKNIIIKMPFIIDSSLPKKVKLTHQNLKKKCAKYSYILESLYYFILYFKNYMKYRCVLKNFTYAT